MMTYEQGERRWFLYQQQRAQHKQKLIYPHPQAPPGPTRCYEAPLLRRVEAPPWIKA